jgi:phosphatidylserine/phosphatidylglycerophosphate/cardiolipin synthase-like enzyme
LEESGLDVRRDRIKGIFHHKFLIGDGRSAGSRAVLTGSYNFTMNATNKNQENFVVLRLSYVASAYQEEFDKLWARHTPAD